MFRVLGSTLGNNFYGHAEWIKTEKSHTYLPIPSLSISISGSQEAMNNELGNKIDNDSREEGKYNDVMSFRQLVLICTLFCVYFR